jgi:hypothetical protein
MPTLSFFDLLGVRGEPSPRDAAIARWPTEWVHTSTGTSGVDLSGIGPMVDFLEAAITLRAVRPGAFPGGAKSGELPRAGLTGELHVGPLPPPSPLVFAALPKIEFYLQETNPAAAPRIYAQKSGLGVEWIIDSLPVEIRLPPRLLIPLEASPGDLPPDQQTVTDGFISGQFDTLKVVLSTNGQSSIFVHVKVRVTDQFDFLLETAIPISIGPCRFSGIPCQAIHDLTFILTPHPSDSLDPRAEALEWVRHALNTKEQPDPPGFITVRSVDLNVTGSRLDDAQTQANANRNDTQHVEGVLEDLVIPSKSDFPIPVHFLAGIRRSLGPTDDPNGVFNLSDNPVVAPLMEGSGKDNEGGLYLILEQFLIQSIADGMSLTDPQSVYLNLVISDDPKAKGSSATVQVTDLWTLEAGIHHEPPVDLFTLWGVKVKGSGARVGVSFQKLFGNDATQTGPSSGTKKFFDAAVLLADLVIQLGSDPPPGNADPVVKLTPTSGKPTQVVVNDFGWKLGSFTIGNFWDPSSTELTAAGVMRLSIDEFGFVTEPNGGRYFSFSGSWPITGMPSTKPASTGTDTTPTSGKALGIQFYRVRWKIRGSRDASDFLMDGAGLSVTFNTFSLLGFGMLSDYNVGDIRFQEAGIALQVQASVAGATIKFGGQFLLGHAKGPSVDFHYIIAGLEVSPIPIAGAIQLVNVRGLFAWNMQPQLGTTDAGTAQPMELFKWYQAHGDGVSLPATRNVATTGWEPKENAWALAVGAGVTFGGHRSITIDAFFLYINSPAVTGFLAALQIFAFKAKKPIAYAVVEIEGDHWSVLAGVSIGLENVTGQKVPLLGDALGLTGTIYATNQPSTFAIGHVNDTSSWLALHVGGDLWIFKIAFFAGVCLEIVDVPEGPRAFGMRASISGGSKLSVLGGIDFYLTEELLAGVWRNESQVSGFVVWFEGGIHIDVLYVFQFGASFKVEWDYLGPAPAYRRVACEVHISTPWWLPDETFSWNRTIGQPQLEQMATISTPVIEAAAYPLAQSDTIPVAVSPLVGTSIDEKATFNISQVTGLTPPAWPPDVLAQAVPVAVDSTIALHFKPSVDDKLIWGQLTPPGMGTESSVDVSTVYELVELGIRRHPRFGPNASVWTTLLDPAHSRTDNLGNTPPQIQSPMGLRWDADFQREQKLDPRHFLLNAEMPYLFFLANFQNDENLVRNMPGWPCCPRTDKGPPTHQITFQGLSPGSRAPSMQFFTESASTLRWVGVAPPVVRPGAQAGIQEEHLAMDVIPEGVFAAIAFDNPAKTVLLNISWPALQVPRSLVVSLFRGLTLINERTLPLSAATTGPIDFSDNLGITHLVMRVAGPPVTAPPGSHAAIIINSLGYQALDEMQDTLIEKLKCGSVNPTLGGNGGRFAWLPNHDYEIQIKTRVTVKDERSGTLQQELPQLIFFRTKGLPGLNAAPRIGQEIEPYVESVYPAGGIMLYRTERAILAFNERFDILQGLDQPPQPNDPDERKQQLDWILAADLILGNNNPARATIPSADWVVSHRGTVPPPPKRRPVVIGLDPTDPILRALTRQAQSTDPLRLRFDAVVVSPGACNQPAAPPRTMRILSHDPVDPDDPTALVKRWPARMLVRMNMRVSGAPFIDRRPFETDDATSFLPAGGAWWVGDGLLTPVNPSVFPEFAIFGDPAWEQFQLTTRIENAGSRAGVAIAVTATPTTSLALIAWVDETQRELRIVTRTGLVENELASAALPDTLTAPYTLQLFAFDDEVQARLGSVVVSALRQEFRAGQLALAAQGPGAFSSLTVDGIDAYRFEFTASRYDDFAAHIGSFRAPVALESLTPASKTIAQLFAAQTKFDDWISALALPLRASTDRLEISIHRAGQNADLLLVESPEPLPLGEDVSLGMFRELNGGFESIQPIVVVPDASRSRALVIPMGAGATPIALTPGKYRLVFTLDRVRYRSSTPDTDSNFRQGVPLVLTL